MRRRYVLALVLATALIFTTVGYYVRTLRDDQSGQCVFITERLKSLAGFENPNNTTVKVVIDIYDEKCR